jgi:dolichol-phosphate mannosyltransferase
MPISRPALNLTVVIPTFKERSNIRPLYALLAKALAGRNWEAVYVDDDSPDGTADEVRALAGEEPNVRLIHRVGLRGRRSPPMSR